MAPWRVLHTVKGDNRKEGIQKAFTVRGLSEAEDTVIREGDLKPERPHTHSGVLLEFLNSFILCPCL